MNELKSQLENQATLNQAENDWSIRENLSHDCSDCKELRKFLLNSSERKLVWPMSKERRRHIHGVISWIDLPVTHVTEHVGSPHKLVLTKTPELFERHKAHKLKVESSLEKFRELGLIQ